MNNKNVKNKLVKRLHDSFISFIAENNYYFVDIQKEEDTIIIYEKHEELTEVNNGEPVIKYSTRTAQINVTKVFGISEWNEKEEIEEFIYQGYKTNNNELVGFGVLIQYNCSDWVAQQLTKRTEKTLPGLDVFLQKTDYNNPNYENGEKIIAKNKRFKESNLVKGRFNYE